MGQTDALAAVLVGCHLRNDLVSEDKPIISFTYTTPDYLAKTEREKLVVYIRKEPVVYLSLIHI